MSLLSNTCQVQIDGASYQHFKYSWSIIYKPRIRDLKRVLKHKLNNPQLFNKYNLFCIGNNLSNANDRHLIDKEKFALKSLNGSLFYAQGLATESNEDLIAQLTAANDSNIDLIEQLKAEATKLEQEIEAQIQFRREQSNSTINFQKDLKEQMSEEYKKIANNLDIKVTKEAIESSYKLLLTQKCNFDEKSITLSTLYKKYQKRFKQAKREYDRIKDKHFEGSNIFSVCHVTNFK